MAEISESMLRSVVSEVLAKLGGAAVSNAVGGGASSSYTGRFGLFTDANDAVLAARQAYEELSRRTMAERKKMIDCIRRICIEQSVELGTMEMNETKIGRLEHKIDKLLNVGYNAQGIEALQTEVFSGDHGLTVVEHAPFGVIGAITPVTHSLPTIANNSINMIAAGNTVVFNPHPGGKRVAAEGVKRFNQAIYAEHGIDNLMTLIVEPTLQSADVIFKHPQVNILVVTGGEGVVKAAMSQSKRAIVAGPGNPPVVVDETADLDRAARCIIEGGAYDNNLLCLAEKEVFVVESVFDQMMAAMERAGALRLNARETDEMTRRGIVAVGEGAARHDAPSREFLGKDATVLAAGIGKQIPNSVVMLFGETDYSNPFVPVEQMMPFLPFVRCKDADQAIERAVEMEHGFHHTAMIHSRNVETMTKMGRAVNTTIYVKNGPSTAGNGGGGEGFGSYSIAGPTGEGITCPMTFTRVRRCAMVDSLRILGK
ncbi:MAG: aldehyde dehydrogenase EutE [Thermoguttaceae bacterium]|nr:aldehyde dehydrogenase EutE [Thermoguttaceae bacterium]MBR3219000.1 aldehyde dehydrogenase EutE [Thermoguttaceae bacterium]